MLLITEIGVRTWTCAKASPTAIRPAMVKVAAAIVRVDRVFTAEFMVVSYYTKSVIALR